MSIELIRMNKRLRASQIPNQAPTTKKNRGLLRAKFYYSCIIYLRNLDTENQEVWALQYFTQNIVLGGLFGKKGFLHHF